MISGVSRPVGRFRTVLHQAALGAYRRLPKTDIIYANPEPEN